MWGAVQASKDENGKPDPYKAAGIAAGMGNFSFSDRLRLGAMLGSQGAFDTNTDGDYSAVSGYGGADNSRRDFCEDGAEYGIDSDDYDLEEEYVESEENAEITLSLSVSCPAPDKLNAIKREDYPNERRYQAAYTLASEYHLCTDLPLDLKSVLPDPEEIRSRIDMKK